MLIHAKCYLIFTCLQAWNTEKGFGFASVGS